MSDLMTVESVPLGINKTKGSEAIHLTSNDMEEDEGFPRMENDMEEEEETGNESDATLPPEEEEGKDDDKVNVTVEINIF